MPTDSYDIGAIRRQILDVFTAQEFESVCREHPAFQPVLRDFGPRATFADMVDNLLHFCDRRRLFPELLAVIEEQKAVTQEPPYVDEGFTIVARVIQQEGYCAAGHRVGDEIVFDGETVQGKVCIHALYSFLPKVFALRYGAEFPWTEDDDVATHACPDAWNPVVFEIRRVRE